VPSALLTSLMVFWIKVILGEGYKSKGLSVKGAQRQPRHRAPARGMLVVGVVEI
jgi:hypothetical protein